MTQRSIKEYAEVMRRRYLKANRRDKWRHTKYPRHEPTKAEVMVTRIYKATNASR